MKFENGIKNELRKENSIQQLPNNSKINFCVIGVFSLKIPHFLIFLKQTVDIVHKLVCALIKIFLPVDLLHSVLRKTTIIFNSVNQILDLITH